MVRCLREDLCLLDGVDKDLALRGAAPVGLWVPPEDVDSEHAEEADGDEGVDPVHGEHERDAHERREQRHPLVVPREGRPPRGRFGDARVEDGEVHEGVGREEEVGGDDGDLVETGDHAEAEGDEEAEDVAAPGVVVGVAALGEPVHAGVDLVQAHGLK